MAAGAAAGLMMPAQKPALPTDVKAVAAEPKPLFPPGTMLKTLQPILTNLGEPATTYVRLEAAVLLDVDTTGAGVLTARLADDIVAHLRTVSLSQLEGPSGFTFLKEDLLRIARTRGQGKVRDLYINAFVVE